MSYNPSTLCINEILQIDLSITCVLMDRISKNFLMFFGKEHDVCSRLSGEWSYYMSALIRVNLVGLLLWIYMSTQTLYMAWSLAVKTFKATLIYLVALLELASDNQAMVVEDR